MMAYYAIFYIECLYYNVVLPLYTVLYCMEGIRCYCMITYTTKLV
jgi:hypothetical protein